MNLMAKLGHLTSRLHFGVLALALAASALVAAACSELGTTTSSGAARRREPAASQPDDTPATSQSGAYAVTFGVRSGGGRLGAIQFEARPRKSGRWQGRGAKVACANITGAAMHACNEKGNGVLSCGLIDTNGIPASSDLVRCVFESDAPVSPADFSIRVVDASNTAPKPVSADVVVTRVKAR